MNQKNAEPGRANEENGQSNARRDFLKQSATATGAVLGLSVLGGLSRAAATASAATASAATASAATASAATASAATASAATFNDNAQKAAVAPIATATIAVAPASLQLGLKEHKTLSKVGGFEIIPLANDTLIVACTEAASFVACSAICPHKGCKVVYEHDAKEFVCPCHDSRFALDGRVLKGPAKTPLKSYATDVAAVISLSAVRAMSSVTSSTPPKRN
jgi:cytochrome b6-f complex iron-sulfur subunit